MCITWADMRSEEEEVFLHLLCVNCYRKVSDAAKRGEVASILDRSPTDWEFCRNCMEKIREEQGRDYM